MRGINKKSSCLGQQFGADQRALEGKTQPTKKAALIMALGLKICDAQNTHTYIYLFLIFENFEPQICTSVKIVTTPTKQIYINIKLK